MNYLCCRKLIGNIDKKIKLSKSQIEIISMGDINHYEDVGASFSQ